MSGDHNNTEPEVAVSGDRVLVVWQNDSGASPYNLSVHYRRYTVDGTPLDDAEQVLSPMINGAAAEGNAWMTGLTAVPGGGFAMVFAWGDPGVNLFQAAVQRFDADGVPSGELIRVEQDAGAGQVFPSIAAASDGTLWAAFLRQPVDASDTLRLAQLPVGASAFDPAVEVSTGGEAGAVHLAAWGEGVVLGQSSSSSSGLGSVGVATADAPDLQLTYGDAGRFDFAPRLTALSAERGALAWMRQVSGSRSQLWVAGFNGGTGGLQAGSSTSIPSETSVFGYQPAVAAVSEDVIFVVWSEGDSTQDSRIQGRFVRVE